MACCHRACMNTQIALRHRSRHSGLSGRLVRQCGLVLLAVLLPGLLWTWKPAPEAGVIQGGTTNQLVHWRDGGHDWLLVIDPSTRELVVYDARDGRPLERLGVDDGLPEVHAIAQQGSSLLVLDEARSKVRRLKLPELRTVAVSDR